MAREVIDSGKYIQVYSDGCMRIDNVVLSHPHLLAKWTPKGSEKSFYAIRPMLHVDDHGETVSIIKDSLNKLMGEKKLGRITRDNNPIRDNSDPEVDVKYEVDVDYYTFNAKEDRQPKILISDTLTDVMADHDEIEELFKNGAIVSILIRPWAFDKGGNKGVAFNLLAVNWQAEGDDIEVGGGDVDVGDVWGSGGDSAPRGDRGSRRTRGGDDEDRGSRRTRGGDDEDRGSRRTRGGDDEDRGSRRTRGGDDEDHGSRRTRGGDDEDHGSRRTRPSRDGGSGGRTL